MPRLNETIIEVLEKLSKLMAKKGDMMRSRVYTKAQETIMKIDTDITDLEQIRNKPGIGPTIMEKLKEYMETGTLALFEREKENPEHLLSEIYGIGPKKAQELVKKGITTIAQLRERQDELLNDNQKAGLKYYEDILERIPRSEIDEYNEVFKQAFDSTKTPGSNYEIVGSYRRGAVTSGDIDMIITSPNPEMFSKFIEKLKETKIILEVLSYGKTKCLVITKLPNKQFARRVDFMYTSPEEYPFAVLYFTGSKAFNTVMRGHALTMGTSLNEHGLYKKQVGKEKEEKVDFSFKNEKDIFDYLKLVYKTPVERIDGRSVVSTEPVPILKEEPKEVKTKKIPKEPKEPKEPKPIETKEKPKKRLIIRDSVKLEDVIIPVIPIQKPVPVPVPEPEPKPVQELKREPVVVEQKPKPEPNKNIEDFRNNGISVLEKLTEKELSEMLLNSNYYYYNTTTPLMSDNEYDIIKEYIQTKYPKNEALTQIGAPILAKKNKVTLPYNMPSMDKIKPDTNALSSWKQKYSGPYLISCKLDGVSGMYTTEGDTPKLYTRGDGTVGQDISHLLKVLNLPKEKGLVVRGEFIIPKKIFDEKYKSSFANPRNLVSGIINSKTVDAKAKDLHFVTYEVIKPLMNPSEQMSKLLETGHEVVRNKLETNITNESLSEVLMDWRKNYEYEIDGIIVCDNNIHARKEGNPDYAFAFKMVISDQIAEAKVVDVIWTPSKAGYLKPRVRIEPIQLGGVKIEYATGFNGNYIETNKIGIGALIQIIRSGDVIPHIKSVTTPAEKAKMPTEPYHWTDTHVDIILDSADEDITVREKNITAFFTGIEVDGLSSGNVNRLMKAGFDTVPKIIHMNKIDYEKVEGFKSKMINKIYDGIKTKLENASLLKTMAASNLLGRGIGERKIKPILEKYPNILTSGETNEQKVEMLKSISGIGKENATSFVENIPKFMIFLKECGLEYKLNMPIAPIENTFEETIPKDTSNPLYGKHVVMTKVRDAKIIDALKRIGGVLDDNIGKNTDYLIVKSKTDVSNKTKYAVEHNIPIMTPDEFIEKFGL